MGSLEFEFVPEWSIPRKILHYVTRFGVVDIALRIVCINSEKHAVRVPLLI